MSHIAFENRESTVSARTQNLQSKKIANKPSKVKKPSTTRYATGSECVNWEFQCEINFYDVED